VTRYRCNSGYFDLRPHDVQRKVGCWQWVLLRTMAWKNKEKS